VRSSVDRGGVASGVPAATSELSGVLARDIGWRTLAEALAACRRRIREEALLDAFEARQAGSTERAYVRLPVAAIGCETWLIRWPAGSVAPLHDHGRAHGLAQVLAGALHEIRFSPGVAQLQVRDWQPGRAIELARGICHEVRNRGVHTAFSVHVYAPRLDQMTFYDRGARGELRAVRQEQTRQWHDAMQVSE
jgi:predicted metal-dependent enzyme (double-stranded beta helix superfamily)